MNLLRKIFRKKDTVREITQKEYDKDYELKFGRGLEAVPGDSHNLADHAIFPFTI